MRSRATGEEVAAKCLKRASTWSPEKFRQRVGEEVAALQHTRHRNVIGLIDHLPDAGGEDRYWVVMKYARGGQLLERLIARHQSTRPYTEVEVAKIAYDVLSGLKHLHDRRIASDRREVTLDQVQDRGSDCPSPTGLSPPEAP